jgi:hypothetical protein
MKFQASRIAKFVLVAAISMSAVGIVGAQENTNTEPTTSTSTTTTTPTTTEPTTTTPTTTTTEPVTPVIPVNPVTPVTPVEPTIPTNPIPNYPIPCGNGFTMNCELPIPVIPVVIPAAPVFVVNYEENVSFNDSDLGVALFKSEDANGQQQMDLFNIQDGTTNGKYMFSVTQKDIAPYMTAHPEKNTLLASGNGVAVYVLTTGEIQVNAGPDAEGKYHVKIFDGIPWTHVYGYTIDAK